MRNIFDQYRHPENRLTHALACCLKEDRRLLSSFVSWATKTSSPKSARLEIVEQRLPGEAEIEEEEAERRGLPDAWIYSPDGWALLIESKVASATDLGQIARHLRMAERRGFQDNRLLLLSFNPPANALARTAHRKWSELYKWAVSQRSSEWAGRLAKYMEVAEGRMLADGYLTEGTLTSFGGIHFDEQNPYSYLESRRLLKLLMDELRARPSLLALGIDPSAPGRPAITGRRGDYVWDFLSLAKAQGQETFTRYPHFTLSIQRDSVIVQVTIPNGLDRQLRNRLVDLGYDSFKDSVAAFLRKAKPLLKTAGCRPFVGALQRHYPTQRSNPVVDASLEFDPRTAIASTGSGVKAQEQWLKATFDAYVNRRSNLQLAVGFSFSYRENSAVRAPSFVALIEQGWLACTPVLKAIGLP